MSFRTHIKPYANARSKMLSITNSTWICYANCETLFNSTWILNDLLLSLSLFFIQFFRILKMHTYICSGWKIKNAFKFIQISNRIQLMFESNEPFQIWSHQLLNEFIRLKKKPVKLYFICLVLQLFKSQKRILNCSARRQIRRQNVRFFWNVLDGYLFQHSFNESELIVNYNFFHSK